MFTCSRWSLRPSDIALAYFDVFSLCRFLWGSSGREQRSVLRQSDANFLRTAWHRSKDRWSDRNTDSRKLPASLQRHTTKDRKTSRTRIEHPNGSDARSRTDDVWPTSRPRFRKVRFRRHTFCGTAGRWQCHLRSGASWSRCVTKADPRSRGFVPTPETQLMRNRPMI